MMDKVTKDTNTTPKVRVTVEYLAPIEGVKVPPVVYEFHTWQMFSKRDIHKVSGLDGSVERLVPDPTDTTMFVGTHTKSPA